MASDGTPEVAAKRCGDAIARLRTQRRWSRAQLVIRLYDELTPDDPNYESISETWLARLENGRMVKVPRQTIEALCRALRCTRRERAWVLLHADRNVLAADCAEPTAAAELLTYAMERLYTEAHDLLTALLGQRDPSQLNQHELYEVMATALELAMAHRRERERHAVGEHVPLPAARAPIALRDGRNGHNGHNGHVAASTLSQHTSATAH